MDKYSEDYFFLEKDDSAEVPFATGTEDTVAKNYMFVLIIRKLFEMRTSIWLAENDEGFFRPTECANKRVKRKK